MEKKIFSLKSKLMILKDNLFESKKYWIIYVILVLIFSISQLNIENFVHPKMEIIMCILVLIVGIFLINYFYTNKDYKKIHKNAFSIILIFGIICSFLTPVMFIPDEWEHFTRSELTSHGEFLPDYNNGSVSTIQTTLDLMDGTGLENSTVFNINTDNIPINYTSANSPAAFSQNPFFGYIAPALGILLAEILNLNAIWLLWLGRIANVFLYASLVTIAVKKTPILKVPMIVFSCIPLAIYSCASMSIDSLINGMGILTIAYFFYLYKTPNLNKFNILKFLILIILLGMCKITFFAFALLFLLIPKTNFERKNDFYLCFLSIILIMITAVLWNKFYANPGMIQSWRYEHSITNNINSTEQINYLLTHKKEFIHSISQLPNYFSTDLSLSVGGIDYLYLMFLGAISFLYPKSRELLKTRLGILSIVAILYIGTYIVLLLTWNPVGEIYNIAGVQPRYFIPLFIFLPFIFGFNHDKENKMEIDTYIIMLTIFFISMMILRRVIVSY